MRPFYLVFFIFSFLLVSCTQPTDSTDKQAVERERIEVSGSIREDTVWESRKEYVVTGDVTVEEGVTLTIQPDVQILFKKETEWDYYGITVEGTSMADGGNSTTAILFTPLDKLVYPTGFTSGPPEWARKPGDWRGIEASPLRLSRTVEASSDSSSVIRYCRIAAGGTSLTL